jgi:lysophospholipase L1-like esterase
MKPILLLFIASALCCLRVHAADPPNVLIIGDSISLGYTPGVIALMKDDANVSHNPGNAQHTGTGLQKLDAWLGDTKWDVIHFNWGLWDLCYRDRESKVQGRRDKVRGKLTTSLEEYERNLDRLVTRLRKTSAVLIWANTTLVPEGEAGRKRGDDLIYNAVAARVMKKHAVVFDDLNTLTRTFAPEQFTKPGDVHYTPEGYQQIANQVADSIRAALQLTAERAHKESISLPDKDLPPGKQSSHRD